MRTISIGAFIESTTPWGPTYVSARGGHIGPPLGSVHGRTLHGNRTPPIASPRVDPSTGKPYPLVRNDTLNNAPLPNCAERRVLAAHHAKKKHHARHHKRKHRHKRKHHRTRKHHRR